MWNTFSSWNKLKGEFPSLPTATDNTTTLEPNWNNDRSFKALFSFFFVRHFAERMFDRETAVCIAEGREIPVSLSGFFCLQFTERDLK